MGYNKHDNTQVCNLTQYEGVCLTPICLLHCFYCLGLSKPWTSSQSANRSTQVSDGSPCFCITKP